MLYTMSDQLRDEGYAKGLKDGEAKERAEAEAKTLKVLKALGISQEEYQRVLAELEAAEQQKNSSASTL